MGGHGHGHAAHGNHNNIKETDEEMLHKIQRIETIKHMPNHWHMEFFDTNNISTIVGGAPAYGYGFLGGAFSLMYYQNQVAHQARHFYLHTLRQTSRFSFGFVLGLWAGYMQFGDRQRLNNAWVAERLRRRYPESLSLHATDLWTLKNVKTTQEFYRWI